MKYFIIVLIAIFISKNNSYAQISWKEVSADFGITQNGFKVYESEGTLADSAFRAFYVKVDKANKNLLMDADTTLYRRFTPNQFYEKLNHPLLVVNCSFLPNAVKYQLRLKLIKLEQGKEPKFVQINQLKV